MRRCAPVFATMLLAACHLTAAEPELKLPGEWRMSAPLISPERRESKPSVSVKDPSVVFHGGKWHVFMTIRCEGLTTMEYTSFDKWENADKSPRHVFKFRDKYSAAPQVFYFRPHKKWYMIFQAGEPGRRLKHHVVYSTTENIADPASWSAPQLLFGDKDPRVEAGLDFWIVCDAQRAWLFYTNLNGKMWRLDTALADFPKGFDRPTVALQADIFEASHTYRLKGMDKYLTVIEAGQSGRRYFKAYLADSLGGQWRPLADTQEKPFAGAANVKPAPGVALWTDNISHGELLRDSNDETMTVDPAQWKFLFQGVMQKDKPGDYGKIPWRIGLLE